MQEGGRDRDRDGETETGGGWEGADGDSDGAPATTQVSIKWVWRAEEQMSLQQAEDKHRPAASGNRMVSCPDYGFHLSS